MGGDPSYPSTTQKASSTTRGALDNDWRTRSATRRRPRYATCAPSTSPRLSVLDLRLQKNENTMAYRPSGKVTVFARDDSNPNQDPTQALGSLGPRSWTCSPSEKLAAEGEIAAAFKYCGAQDDASVVVGSVAPGGVERHDRAAFVWVDADLRQLLPHRSGTTS